MTLMIIMQLFLIITPNICFTLRHIETLYHTVKDYCLHSMPVLNTSKFKTKHFYLVVGLQYFRYHISPFALVS